MLPAVIAEICSWGTCSSVSTISNHRKFWENWNWEVWPRWKFMICISKLYHHNSGYHFGICRLNAQLTNNRCSRWTFEWKDAYTILVNLEQVEAVLNAGTILATNSAICWFSSGMMVLNVGMTWEQRFDIRGSGMGATMILAYMYPSSAICRVRGTLQVGNLLVTTSITWMKKEYSVTSKVRLKESLSLDHGIYIY